LGVTHLLETQIKNFASQLGFALAGITTPEPPPHLPAYENWLEMGRHASMAYLADERSRTRRADPRLILPECQSILVLAFRYSPPEPQASTGRIAAYAQGDDYHLTLPPKLESLVKFIETQVGHPIPNRWYTDTGPILERDLAMRAGLGWIGKNTLLINPRIGSYFLLAEILLGIPLEPDSPFQTDHCGTCTRCIEACPTACIRPDRTLDAGRCISYLTIENKDEIPADLRPNIGEWVFGCDVCQMVCPWNKRFSARGLAPAPEVPESNSPSLDLANELSLTSEQFNRKFKASPIKRAKRRSYLRNVAVVIGNIGNQENIPDLEKSLQDNEPLISQHSQWAIETIKQRHSE
jgi:epoxyqueuosine reductase